MQLEIFSAVIFTKNFFSFQGLLDKSAEPSLRQQLLQGYDMLMNPKKMGERFNFFALLPHQRLCCGNPQITEHQSKPSPSPVAGFSELAWR